MHRNMKSMECKLVKKALLSNDAEHLKAQMYYCWDKNDSFLFFTWKISGGISSDKETSWSGFLLPVNYQFLLSPLLQCFGAHSEPNPCPCSTEDSGKFYPFLVG